MQILEVCKNYELHLFIFIFIFENNYGNSTVCYLEELIIRKYNS